MNAGYRLAKPVHPGGFVRRKILEPRNLSIMGAAHVLGTTRQALSDFVNEKCGISADIALKIENIFGFDMETLMNMQTRYDIAVARQRERARQVRITSGAGSQSSKGAPAIRQRLTAA